MSDLQSLKTAFNKGSLFKKPTGDSSNQLLANLDELATYEGDPSWLYHRSTRVDGPSLKWAFPLSSEEKKNNSPAKTEIMPRASQVVAVRGVYLESNFGFMLMHKAKGKWEVVCKTTEAVHHLGENSFTTKSSTPLQILPRPFQPHKSKAAPTEFNGMLQRMPHIELFGSRPPVGYPGDPKTYRGRPRTCAECVAAQENNLPADEENPKGSNCRGSGYALLCVFELGVLDPDYNPLKEQAPKVIWKPIHEWGLVTSKGNERSEMKKPFILRVEGMGRGQINPIGKGQYERDIMLPGPNSSSYLPEGTAMSFGTFYENAVKKIAELPDGSPCYPFVTEMYIGEVLNDTTTKVAPVFYIHEEEELVRKGLTLSQFSALSQGHDVPAAKEEASLEDWIMIALMTRAAEEAEARGAQLAMLEDDQIEGASAAPQITSAQPTPTPVAPAEPAIDVPAQPAATSPSPAPATPQPAATSAFSMFQPED